MVDLVGSKTLEEGRLKALGKEKKAFLVSFYSSSKEKPSCNEHLEELEALADTYGMKVFGKIACPLRKIEAATFIGKGKVQEIFEETQQLGIDIIIFDTEMSPHQQRNLEKACKCIVIDRTELILGVFAIHARTKEAKIQINLAMYKYQLPRLRRLWTHLGRQRVGGKSGGFLKGEGERQIEIDRRILKSKIAQLQKELLEIKKQRQLQRSSRQRRKIPSFAIIGYTNSGKSTLLNALTKADVLVENKLFATLDTTTRQYTLPNNQKILLIDTVGFIRKLPHNLIAAFKSTLEEVLYTDILLHLIDVSNPTAREQAKATYKVLEELNAEKRPIITCLNKIDLCSDKKVLTYFRIKYPKIVKISALKKIGFDDLMKKMKKEVSNLRKVFYLKVPQSHFTLVSELMKEGKVYQCDYKENDILLDIEVPAYLEKKVQPFLIRK